MKLKFSKTECYHILRISSKLAVAKSTDANVQKIIKELVNKFNLQFAEGQKEIEVPLQRRHLRGIEAIIGTSRQVLKENIIPAYEKRGIYPEQMERAKVMLTEYDALLAKIEAAL